MTLYCDIGLKILKILVLGKIMISKQSKTCNSQNFRLFLIAYFVQNLNSKSL
jgi:hypothetical protein